MEWQTTHIDGIEVLTINGRFDAHGAPAIKTWLLQAAAGDKPKVLVRLADAHFIDSAALATLIAGLKQCRTRGGALILCELAQPVRIIFELTQMDQMFTIVDSAAAALAAFRTTTEVVA